MNDFETSGRPEETETETETEEPKGVGIYDVRLPWLDTC